MKTIGVEFAQLLFGERFEVVIGTHLDKAHLHNHIVINSVSFFDGLKYHSSPESYYNNFRGTSDALCQGGNLSVIAPKSHGKHYAEWKAEQNGRPTIRDTIRADIDGIIAEAYTFSSFLMRLEKRGYTVKHGPDRKYIAIKPPGAQRFYGWTLWGKAIQKRPSSAAYPISVRARRSLGLFCRYISKGTIICKVSWQTSRKRRLRAFWLSISSIFTCCAVSGEQKRPTGRHLHFEKK